MDGILHWIDEVQDMIVETGAVNKSKVFAEEGEITPIELPELAPMVVYLDEAGALAWDSIIQKLKSARLLARREHDLTSAEIYNNPNIMSDLVEQAVSSVMDVETSSAGIDELEKLGLVDKERESLSKAGLHLIKQFL